MLYFILLYVLGSYLYLLYVHGGNTIKCAFVLLIFILCSQTTKPQKFIDNGRFIFYPLEYMHLACLSLINMMSLI